MVMTMDGPIDRGVEPGAGDEAHSLAAEAGAHAVLRLVCDLPGSMGRLRVARVVGGFSVPFREETPPELLARYAVELGWPLREVIALVDAMLDGGLLVQTIGARPTLVLTRAGFLALHALEHGAGGSGGGGGAGER